VIHSIGSRIAVRCIAVVGASLALAASWVGCSQNAVTVPIRSLERSGKAAFVCLQNLNGAQPGLPLDACHAVSPPLAANDFVTAPHMISLVTQTSRGEVAVVDVTASGVIDLDLSVPGFNFLPVGNLPTDVVATPGSTAAFVSVADPNRPGIFAISMSHIFPTPTAPDGGVGRNRAPTLADLPACGLPSAPSEMVLVRNLAAGPGAPISCDAASPVASPIDPGYSLAAETSVYGPLKLLVNLPELRKIAVVDAQSLLARAPGSFDLCPIEATLDLSQDVPIMSPANAMTVASEAGAAPTDGDAPIVAEASVATDASSAVSDAGAASCSERKSSAPRFGTVPHPASMAYADDGRLFITDDGVSAIHVIDARDPCRLSLMDPLLPISRADPGRAVQGGAIAVSPLTTDLKRFVYAVDLKDNGSVMIFDVSQGSTDRTPLVRPDVQFNQFEPSDRMAFGSAVQSLTFGTQEIPLNVSGQVQRGVKCDPSAMADINRTSVDFTTGAGPRTLRGTFGFLILATGQVMVVDLDDFDAACRRPKDTDDVKLGCGSTNGMPLADKTNLFPSSSLEVSCRVVERHRPRSQLFISQVDAAGRHAPAMQTFPLLRDKDGTVLSVDPSADAALTRPKLLGPCLDPSPNSFACSCSSDTTKQVPPEIAFLASVPGVTSTPADFCATPYPADLTKPPPQNAPVARHNWVAFDLREPRAHVEQGWSITFEGVLSPFFASRRGRLACASGAQNIECERGANKSHFTLLDSDAGFCDQGAQGADLAKQQGLASGDIVEIIDPLPDPSDPYWGTVANVCSPAICEAQYGTPDKPVEINLDKQIAARGLDPHETWLRRDLLVTKSFQDRLELEPSFAGDGAPLTCCFPFPVTYQVRGGSQWIVNGGTTGFEHHLIPDPTTLPDTSTAACIISCDLDLQLRNGRVPRRPSTSPTVPNLSDLSLFRNQAMQFVVWDPAQFTCNERPCLQRDMAFTFQEVGGFSPMAVPLSASAFVLPQAITFVPGLSQLAIPDAVSQGLILFDLRRIATTQTIF
jgi:hypothetical protein